MSQRTLFAAIVGAPNAGKSTLTNYLVGSKVTIVSPKVQTTRTRVSGIAMEGDAQLVLIDTPGIFKPRKTLDKAMVRSAWGGLGSADLVVLIVDSKKATRGIEDDLPIIQGIKERELPAILVLNKVDVVEKPKLLGVAQAYYDAFPFEQSFMISASKGDGIKELRQYLAKQAKEVPWAFPEDQLSDMPMRLFAAEITREQLFYQLKQELPYQLMVETESWEEGKNGTKVNQAIYVENENQKKIIIGKGGSQIKQIGEKARAGMEKVIGGKVHLFLFVKVRENWQDSTESYRIMGLEG